MNHADYRLKETEEFYPAYLDRIFNALDSLVIIWDKKRIVFCNDKAKKILCLSEKDGKTTGLESTFINHLNTFRIDGEIPGPYPMAIHKNGTDYLLTWEFIGFTDKKDSAKCVGISRLEEEVSNGHEKGGKGNKYDMEMLSHKFNSILRHSHDMIVILDEKGVCRFISPSVSSQLGYSSQNILGRSLKDFLASDKLKIVEGDFESILHSKEEKKINVWVENPSGDKLFIESYGINLTHDPMIKGILFSARNITDLKKVEMLLNERMEAELLLNRVSRGFVNASFQEIDKTFFDNLGLVGSHKLADEAGILQLHSEVETFEIVYKWVKGNRQTPDMDTMSMSYSTNLVSIQKLMKGEILIITDILKLEKDFSFEKELFLKHNIASLILTPIFAEKKLIGIFYLCCYKRNQVWEMEDDYFFKQLADLFGGSLVHKYIKKGLLRNEKLLTATELLAKSGSWRYSNSQRKIYFSNGLNKLLELDDHLNSVNLEDFYGLIMIKEKNKIMHKIKSAIKHKSSTTGEFIFITKSGEQKYIFFNVQVYREPNRNKLEVYGFCNDITKKRAAEKNLVLQSQILAQVNDPIFVTDLDLKIIYMNQAALDEFGVTGIEEVHDKMDMLFSFSNFNLVYFNEIIRIVNNEDTWVGEVLLNKTDTDTEPYEFSVKSFKNDVEEPIGYSFLIRNLSLKKKNEDLANKAKLIIENSPTILFVLDPNENFKLTFITENISQFGYKAKEIIEEGRSILDFIHPEDATVFLRSLEKKRSKKGIHSMSGEYRFMNSHGIYRWVEDKTRDIVDHEGNVLFHEGLFQDITDTKSYRSEIEKSKNRYRVLASNIPYTNVFLIDRELNYVLAEGPNFKYWGLDKQYFEGKSLEEAHTTNFEEIAPNVIKAFQEKITVRNELNYMNRIYEVIAKPILNGGEVEYVLGIVRDITEEYRIRRDLQKSEAKYRNLVEESTEIIYSISAMMELTYVSPNIKQFLGYETYEFTAGNFTDFLHPDDLRAITKESGDNKSYFELNPCFEFRLRDKKGDYRVFSSSGKVIRDETGRFRYYTGIARDISSLKQAQKELFIAKEKAEQALMVKSQFLSIMSHEIRTPMNAVIGMSHLLMESNPRKDQLENLRTLQFSAENLLGLINDILDYSKIDSGKIELENILFDPKNIVNRIIHSYTYQLRDKSLKMKTAFDENLPQNIYGDPVRLSQILNNLVSNAIKFTDEGYVKIALSVSYQNETKVKIKFDIEDTGIGIAENKKHLVFEAFTQASTDTTRKYGGTGLGLAIVKKLIELLKSKIQIISKPKGGTIFSFDIVFGKENKLDNKIHTKAVKLEKSLKALSILVAEDNLVNQIMMRKFLSKWDVGNVEFANNGKQAIEIFLEKEFDIVLLDLQMPEIDGFEVARYIRALESERKKNVPIIALTAASLTEIKDQLEEVGMNDYISKPFYPDNLYSKIIKFLKI